MLNVKIAVDTMNFEKTLSTFYPMLMDVLNRQDSSNIGIQILQRVGRASEDAIFSLMRKLSNADKSAMLVYLFQNNKEMIVEKIRSVLRRSRYSNCFTFKNITATVAYNGINIYLHDVEINYKEVLSLFPEMSSSAAAFGIKAAKVFSAFTPNRIFGNVGDYAALKILENTETVNMITRIGQDALQNNGIHARVANIRISKVGDSNISMPAASACNVPMPQQLSDKLVNTVSTFILDLLNSRKQTYSPAYR